MSGSSLDGVDLGMVEFQFENDKITKWEMLDAREVSYSSEIQNDLAKAAQQSAFGLLSLDARLGQVLGNLCREFIDDLAIKPDYIASHGHAVIHAPSFNYTLQIGSPSIISAITGCPVISDFRSADIANGGQGAPLAPIVEKHLFSGYGYYLNLGGIGNLSAHIPNRIQAWDICPANQLLNNLANKLGLPYDDNGTIAQSGNLDVILLDALQSVVPLPLTTPYSLDNSFVMRSYSPILRESQSATNDQMHTVVEFIALAVATQCKGVVTNFEKIAKSILITGGGAHNSFLIGRIKHHLMPLGIEVVVPSSDIINFKEAILMALCGLLRIHRLPNALSSVTGATRDTVNGTIHYG